MFCKRTTVEAARVLFSFKRAEGESPAVLLSLLPATSRTSLALSHLVVPEAVGGRRAMMDDVQLWRDGAGRCQRGR